MTETPQRADEPATRPVDTLPPPVHIRPDPRPARAPRLYQAAAWVAIVAGIVFIVGAVFFTGFFLGRHGGGFGHGNHHRLDQSEFRRELRLPPRMMPLSPGQMGPGEIGPGSGPAPSTPPARP